MGLGATNVRTLFKNILLLFVYDIGSCGQSYKHFTIVIYDPRVIIWGVFKSGMTLES